MPLTSELIETGLVLVILSKTRHHFTSMEAAQKGTTPIGRTTEQMVREIKWVSHVLLGSWSSVSSSLEYMLTGPILNTKFPGEM